MIGGHGGVTYGLGFRVEGCFEKLPCSGYTGKMNIGYTYCWLARHEGMDP